MDRKRSRKMGSKSAKAGMGTKRPEKKFTPFISFESFKEGSDYKNHVEPKNYQSGGSVMNDMDAIDMAVAKILADEAGKTISDADRSRVMNKMRGATEGGKTISDADLSRMQSMMGGVRPPRRRPSNMPRSKPRSYMEDYTSPLNRDGIKFFEDGGEVGGSCRGGGAAVRGTKFRGVK